MTKLTTIEGGLTKETGHIYEVHDGEGYIIDVLRFNNDEDAAEFQSELTGGYYVRPHTLPVNELLDLVLDLHELDYETQKGSGLDMDKKVVDLVEKIKELPEFQADGETLKLGGFFTIKVESNSNISKDLESPTTYDISVYEVFIGEILGERFLYEEGGEDFQLESSGEFLSQTEVVQLIQGYMQEFAGVPVDGVFAD